MVIWITGLSASGKTTLSKAFEKKSRPAIPNLVLLDGDTIRLLYGNDLGYTEPDRVIQIRRVQTLARFLEQQSILVVVAALYARDDLLAENRKLFEEYLEVYLKADIEFLQTRETKHLYKKALNREIANVVGVDIPWHAPKHPDLTFDIRSGESPQRMADVIFGRLATSKR